MMKAGRGRSEGGRRLTCTSSRFPWTRRCRCWDTAMSRTNPAAACCTLGAHYHLRRHIRWAANRNRAIQVTCQLQETVACVCQAVASLPVRFLWADKPACSESEKNDNKFLFIYYIYMPEQKGQIKGKKKMQKKKKCGLNKLWEGNNAELNRVKSHIILLLGGGGRK